MVNRREFLSAAATASLLGSDLTNLACGAASIPRIEVDLPRGRVPLSFIIDDSTCLVNMGKFCMPQFATAHPERAEYKKPWQDWPAEIPDSFVREFGSWCAEHDVRGKYSIVPYPACVGWLDRELPGWSHKQLQESLQLVRELMVPRWDIHPEMITHTRLIDLATGRPKAEISAATMENSFPQQDVSVDELAAYLAYALRILKNCDLPCEGITTPGGFGNKVKDKLPLAVFQAVRDVYGTELPHYFKYVSLNEESVLPRFENLQGVDRAAPSLTVNIPAGTGDWFGGWDGVEESRGELYANADATSGRMVELIEKRLPAVMLCHWPGLYCNGLLSGYRDFQKVVLALEQRFKEQTLWMKVSEIGRYWTAKEFTKFELSGTTLTLNAPFSCPNFTIQIALPEQPSKLLLERGGQTTAIEAVPSLPSLVAGSYLREERKLTVCFDLQQGVSRIQFTSSV